MALVTGGAKRVGRAVALRLAECGMDVAITYRSSSDAAAEVVNEIRAMGRQAVAIRADLEQRDVGEQVYKQFERHFDRLDALINNAAIFWPCRLWQVDADDYDRFQAVNARGPLLLMRAFASMLADNWDEDDPATTGRVVNFVDIHVMGEPMPGYIAYSASKAALLEITTSAAVELAPRVTVNAIAPGVVAWAEEFDEKQRQQYLARVPLGRAGTPADAAEAVRFLVCDAHYCTGQVIRIDGGRLLK
ncbi:SDR family oxidoreductase [Phycisphaerales bacterium AB-hyl4]|uniref:SDR family oxidoreductase n=1 Tax=Natronomicrosphaera hydrolytica TaxID=3242702 RepID=A0ABV4U4S4_9BACT